LPFGLRCGAGGSLHQNNQFQDYKSKFVQPIPRYAVKGKNGWRSKNKPICDKVIKAHLNHQYSVGVLGRWYPEYAVFDFDDVSLKMVDNVRERLSLDDSNSMLQASESADSYHLLLRPIYSGKPPTIRLLQSILKPYADDYGVEIYPQQNRVIRLPFGQHSAGLDFKYHYLNGWQDKLYWFGKLDDYPLEDVKYHQLSLDLKPYRKPRLEFGGVSHEGQELYLNGLQAPSTRNENQFKVIYFLWRSNVGKDATKRLVWRWIKGKHNGFSKDIVRHPQRVKYEVEYQTDWVYSRYDLANIYPDSTHNTFNGYIAKDDIFEIVEACSGSLPRMRFLFQLIKYAYPRKYRIFIKLHSNKLQEWGSWRSYQKYLNEFESKGILKRGSAYKVSQYSKSIKLNWEFKDSSQAVLLEGRSVDTFNEAVKLVHKPPELADKLKSVGVSKQMRSHIVRTVFEKGQIM
jgi:hypothetical protein